MTISIALSEWSQKTPTEHTSPLSGMFLEDADAKRLAQQLMEAGMLEVRELREGLSISSTSYVGRIKLGDLVITIWPKIRGMPLMHLLRYAYSLRDLHMVSQVGYGQEPWAFQEILIAQLIEETRELVARGLHRRYRRTDEKLVNLQGRIDIQRIAKQGGATQATLPCTSYPRLEDCLVNQVLLQGLDMAARLTTERAQRVHLSRLSSMLRESISFRHLDATLFKQLHREMDRLTSAYQPALTLVELLFTGGGISLASSQQDTHLPGFLFDMNHFFQALLSRFLTEHLTEYEMRNQYTIKDMMRYDPGFNPRRRRAPSPRPDYVATQHGKVVSILDAKYRDLWELDLPAQWLYQLAIYALSRQQEKVAVMLYPTTDDKAREARIVLSEPTFGTGQATVVLRPVNLLHLEHLVTGASTAAHERERKAYAEWLVFGDG